MEWLQYVIFIGVFIFLLWFYIGLQIALMIVRPNIKSISQTMVEESERDPSLIPYLNKHLTNKHRIKSKYHYSIQVYEMIENEESKRFVVMAHGYTYSHHGTIKYAKMMIELGYNVILYDHRFHGESGGKNTTLGYHEQYDLETVINYVFEKYGNDVYLGTYGESMGSATCLLEQAYDQRVKFVISDAGFKNLKLLIKSRIKTKRLPAWLFYGVVNFNVWLITKGNFSKVSPIYSIKDSKIPILFVHGKMDDFIPYQHTVDMYDSYLGKKMLYLAEKNAYHARSFYDNRDEYFKMLKDFNDQYLNN
ncbi:MAG: alpha/beta hydrolase [Candidatus Izemoplasmatales bacterium]